MSGAHSREDFMEEESSRWISGSAYFSGCRAGRPSRRAGRRSGGMGGSHVLEGSRAWHETGSGPDYREPQTEDSKPGAQPLALRALGGLKTEERLDPCVPGEGLYRLSVWNLNCFSESPGEQWRDTELGLTQEQVGKLTTCKRR